MNPARPGRPAGSPHQPSLACPLCGPGGSYRRVARLHGADGPPYAVFRCQAHGVEFADAGDAVAGGGADQAVLDLLYGEVSDSTSPRYVDFMDRVERAAGSAAVRSGDDGGPRRLHDVGCGNGQLLVEARRRGWAVQGNDLVVSVRGPLEGRGIDYHEGGLASLDLPAASCDVVTSFCVLPHHLADPMPDLRAVARLLRPGGTFVAELPSDGIYRRAAWLLYRLSRGRIGLPLANIYDPAGHVFGYNAASIRALLNATGFEHVVVEPYAQPASMSTARFARRPALFRGLARLAVGGLSVAGRLLGRPNHILVVARTPADAVSDRPNAARGDRFAGLPFGG